MPASQINAVLTGAIPVYYKDFQMFFAVNCLRTAKPDKASSALYCLETAPLELAIPREVSVSDSDFSPSIRCLVTKKSVPTGPTVIVKEVFSDRGILDLGSIDLGKEKFPMETVLFVDKDISQYRSVFSSGEICFLKLDRKLLSVSLDFKTWEHIDSQAVKSWESRLSEVQNNIVVLQSGCCLLITEPVRNLISLLINRGTLFFSYSTVLREPIMKRLQ